MVVIKILSFIATEYGTTVMLCLLYSEIPCSCVNIFEGERGIRGSSRKWDREDKV